MTDTNEKRLTSLEIGQVRVTEQQKTVFGTLTDIKKDLGDMRTQFDTKLDALVDAISSSNSQNAKDLSALGGIKARLDSLEDHCKSVMRVVWGAVGSSVAAILWASTKT
jgi:uncharacterized coiled-coil protein SlyX